MNDSAIQGSHHDPELIGGRIYLGHLILAEDKEVITVVDSGTRWRMSEAMPVAGHHKIYTGLACTTGRADSYLAPDAPDDSFFLVVPRTSGNEGSYGLTGTGAERPPAATPCRPQGVGSVRD